MYIHTHMHRPTYKHMYQYTYSIYIHKLTLPALHDYLQNINNNSLIIIHIC